MDIVLPLFFAVLSGCAIACARAYVRHMEDKANLSRAKLEYTELLKTIASDMHDATAIEQSAPKRKPGRPKKQG